MSHIRTFFDLLKQTFTAWNADKAPRLAAALAYYTVFSLAPFLIVVIAVAGLVFGQDAVRGQLDNQIEGLVGAQGADIIQELLQNAQRPADNIIATVIGLVTLLLGAGGVFGQLQDALNTVWNVQPRPMTFWQTLKARFFSFAMVLGVGFLLLVSLVITTVLSAFNQVMAGWLPGLDALWQIVNFAVSFGIITVLFALIYKLLPDTDVRWRDVWVGAAFTSLLFGIGRFVLGLYLGGGAVASPYGAAGSLVVVLLWIFYSAQILLFGAEFTQVYAHRHGSRSDGTGGSTPRGYAVRQIDSV